MYGWERECAPKACKQSCIESKAGCAGVVFECPLMPLAVPLAVIIVSMSAGMRGGDRICVFCLD
jgi:hypothetical protein